MVKNFEFTWYKNVKYGQPIERKNIIKVSDGKNLELGTIAHMATETFCNTFGNLKKNTIISIQELNEKGEPVGESIIPEDESGMIPIAK